MAEDIKYIKIFWKNIKEFSTDVDLLKENFEYHFLNDMIDNHRKWKEDIQLINEDLDLYFNKKKIFTTNKEDIYMSYDIFVKLFIKNGLEYITKYESLKTDDMKYIIQNTIDEHIQSLDAKYTNNSVQNTVELTDSIKKPKMIF